MRVGRLHTHLPGWEEGNVAFMASGGYSLGPEAVRAVACARTLLVWGENDEILPPATLVEKFREDLPKGNGRTEFVSVAKCGHCPHLEQPEKLAEAVAAFVKGGGGGGGGSGGGAGAVQHGARGKREEKQRERRGCTGRDHHRARPPHPLSLKSRRGRASGGRG